MTTLPQTLWTDYRSGLYQGWDGLVATLLTVVSLSGHHDDIQFAPGENKTRFQGMIFLIGGAQRVEIIISAEKPSCKLTPDDAIVARSRIQHEVPGLPAPGNRQSDAPVREVVDY